MNASNVGGSGVHDAIVQEDGSRFWYWTVQPEGEKWCCAAQNHSPFCRRCQPVEDEVMDNCIQNVLDGLFVVAANPDGTLKFRMTEEGIRRARHLLETSDDPVIKEVKRRIDNGETPPHDKGATHAD